MARQMVRPRQGARKFNRERNRTRALNVQHPPRGGWRL